MPFNKRKRQRAPSTASEPSLRQRAEAELGAAATEVQTARSPEETRRLLHELQVHQIELELQNEELRRTQAELERSRARYFDLYDLAPVGYVTLNARGLIQEANLTLATLLQVARSSLQHLPLSRFVAPEDQETYYQHQRRLVATGAPQTAELRLLPADGTPLWARLEATMAEDAAGEAAVYRTVLSDITARVQAERALRELNATLAERVDAQTAALIEREEHLCTTNAELTRALKLKDEFLAMMSHELRTPLNAILGRSELLLEAIYGPVTSRQIEAIHSIAESGQHLLSLINDILDLAKIETGKLELAYAAVDIGRICHTSLSMVAQIALSKRIGISFKREGVVDAVWGDERHLKQVLVNLLSNAVKFTPEDGKVGLDVDGDDVERTLTFTVWDTGIGIAIADMPKLFQPFVQIDSSLSRRYTGTGLGLALVLRLVEAHGGSVAVESTPGQGSRFRVVLPWEPGAPVADLPAFAAEAHLRLSSGPGIAPGLQRPRILVAEDKHTNSDVLYDYLQAKGYDVTVAHNGGEALLRAHEEPPAAILIDIQMPVMDGMEAIRRLRADPELCRVPIIAVTALAMPGDRERCMATGADDYQIKPVNLRRLVAQIEALRHGRA